MNVVWKGQFQGVTKAGIWIKVNFATQVFGVAA